LAASTVVVGRLWLREKEETDAAEEEEREREREAAGTGEEVGRRRQIGTKERFAVGRGIEGQR
jgi:hypothetical protein